MPKVRQETKKILQNTAFHITKRGNYSPYLTLTDIKSITEWLPNGMYHPISRQSCPRTTKLPNLDITDSNMIGAWSETVCAGMV